MRSRFAALRVQPSGETSGICHSGGRPALSQYAKMKPLTSATSYDFSRADLGGGASRAATHLPLISYWKP